MPKISIVVPVYNVEAYFDRFVQSVLHQTFPDYELLLVNDGSTDSSGQMCEEYAKKDTRIRVFHKENGGQATARNLALDWINENSNSEWVTFIDSDDWVHSRYLEVLLSAAETQNADITACGYHVVDGFRCEEAVTDISVVSLEPECAFVNYHSFFMPPWGKLFKRELFRELRFPNFRKYEDAFITHLPVFVSGSIAVTECQLYYYFVRSDSTSHSKWTVASLSQLEAFEQRLDDCRKWNYQNAYKKELEEYTWAICGQVQSLTLLSKEDVSYIKYKNQLYPRMKRVFTAARKHKVIRFNRRNMWMYELAYPVKLFWYCVNLLLRE